MNPSAVRLRKDVTQIYWQTSSWHLMTHKNMLQHYTLKKIVFFLNPSKRFCRCQKASKWVEMSKKSNKNSTKPKMVLHLDTAKEPSLRNLFKFRTKLRDLVYFLRNWKRFRSEGSFAVSRWSTILGFVEFFIAFFRHFNSFGSFLTSTEPFWGVREKTYFFRV